MDIEPHNQKHSEQATASIDPVSGINVVPSVVAKGDWTCPMHSEIVRDAPGDCPRCGMALELRTASGVAENLRENAVTSHNRSASPRFHIPIWLGAALFSAVALYFLWGEHKVHILGALPYLLLASCPLIHIFMHRGHGHGHDHGDSSPSGSEDHSHHGAKP